MHELNPYQDVVESTRVSISLVANVFSLMKIFRLSKLPIYLPNQQMISIETQQLQALRLNICPLNGSTRCILDPTIPAGARETLKGKQRCIPPMYH